MHTEYDCCLNFKNPIERALIYVEHFTLQNRHRRALVQAAQAMERAQHSHTQRTMVMVHSNQMAMVREALRDLVMDFPLQVS